MNNKIWGFFGSEWLSLFIIITVLGSSLFGLQQMGGNKISIEGTPHFIENIGAKKLKNPLAVAFVDKNIIVTSSGESNVKIFNEKGEDASIIELVKDSYPTSLAVSKDGIIYIGDLTKKAIYKASITSQKAEKLKIKNDFQPVSMAFHQDKLLVFDRLSQKIKYLNEEETKLVDYIKDKKLNLSYANGIFSDNNKIYIADSNSRRILQLSANGKYLATLKNFSLPRGVAVDSLKRLHVVDTFAHSVKVFDSSGQATFGYGSEGSDDEQLYFPNGIALDSKNARIYIADKGNNRVQVWGW